VFPSLVLHDLTVPSVFAVVRWIAGRLASGEARRSAREIGGYGRTDEVAGTGEVDAAGESASRRGALKKFAVAGAAAWAAPVVLSTPAYAQGSCGTPTITLACVEIEGASCVDISVTCLTGQNVAIYVDFVPERCIEGVQGSYTDLICADGEVCVSVNTDCSNDVFDLSECIAGCPQP
jgi:hypothetical protein